VGGGEDKERESEMSVTLLEVLMNADYNLQHNGSVGVVLAKEQLHNATVLLEKGYHINDVFDDIMEKYDNVDDVPEIES